MHLWIVHKPRFEWEDVSLKANIRVEATDADLLDSKREQDIPRRAAQRAWVSGCREDHASGNHRTGRTEGPPLAATPFTVSKSRNALNVQITFPLASTARRIPSHPPVKITPGMALAGPACPRWSALIAAFQSTLPVLISRAFRPPPACCNG